MARFRLAWALVAGCLGGCAPAYKGPVFPDDPQDPDVRRAILETPARQPVLGALAATLPAAGHWYAGDTAGALAVAGRLYLLWPAVLLGGVALIASDTPAPMQGPLTGPGFALVLLGGGIWFGDWTWSFFDAYQSVVRYNEALEAAKARLRAGEPAGSR